MPESHTRSGSRTFAAVVTAVLVLALCAGIAGPAQARIVPARATYAGAIEPFAAYQGQRSCSPTPKPGVVDLSRRLLKAFPSTRSLGIVRACSVGGQSEHKEGRAFDWGVSAKSPTGRAQVAKFVAWLAKADKYGNRYAMARRLGIQYVIWNRKIWGSYAATAGWRKYSGANPHTDHVHISFTWAGARKQTSFWTGKVGKVNAAPPSIPTVPTVPAVPSTPGAPKPRPTVPPPPPTGGAKPTTLPPRNQPAPAAALLPGPPLTDETVTLGGAAAGVVTTGALVAGQQYLIEASGTWQYGNKPGMVSDAECSTATTDATWRRDRSVHSWDPTNDHLDLYVDGQDLFSEPDTDSGGRCDTATHTYRYLYTAGRTGRVPFESWDPTPANDNSGALSIRILSWSPGDDMTMVVPASAGAGVTSPGTLTAGSTYVVTVSGAVDAGAGVTADAECSVTTGDPVWRRDRAADPANPAAHRLNVLVDKQDKVFDAVTDDGTGCNTTDHTYRLVLKPTSTKTINLRVDDPAPADDGGALTVRIVRVVQPSGVETVSLDTAKPGAVSARTYLAGGRLKVTATGTYTYAPGISADAECTATTGSWAPKRSGLPGATGTDPADVLVNGLLQTWAPVTGGSCDAVGHSYTVFVIPVKTGPLSFAVADLNLADNVGTVTLSVEPVA
ncbi:MAG: hypothetical protein QOE19_3333 [Actinomycetota bacterium]|nr:hypothetical protein [Actinomycetota bacterium]